MVELAQKKLSIVIMAHADRKEWAEALSASLGGVPIVWDRMNDLWDTCRRAWEAIDKTAEYGLVLQDDVVACRDFVSRAEAILTGRFVYNFFIHSALAEKVRLALVDGKKEFYRPKIASEVAICLRTEWIDCMIQYCQKHGAVDDTLISIWAQQRHIKVCYPIPSLVDHRASESLFLKYTNRPQRSGAHSTRWFADNFKD